MSMKVQIAFLRVLQEKRIHVLGSSCGREVGIMIVAATNAPLE